MSQIRKPFGKLWNFSFRVTQQNNNKKTLVKNDINDDTIIMEVALTFKIPKNKTPSIVMDENEIKKYIDRII